MQRLFVVDRVLAAAIGEGFSQKVLVMRRPVVSGGGMGAFFSPRGRGNGRQQGGGDANGYQQAMDERHEGKDRT